ncbi:MAG: hypothetical protein WCD76_19160 [Pyrinomonadaceae bacterium]
MNPNLPHQNQSHAPHQSRAPQFLRHSIVDHQNGEMEVSSFAYPSDWQARSQVVWNMQDTNVPALAHAATFSRNRVESFEFLPMQVFFWLEGDYGLVPIGQKRHGLIRMPPRSAPDALAGLVIPYFRGNRQNLRVTGVQPVQNLWQLFNDPPPQQGESVMARVEYEEHGRAVEEEFYGACDYVPATGGSLNWGFARLFCFRAERGQLDAMRETFWQIARSLQNSPQWLQHYNQIAQQLMAGFMVQTAETYRRFEREKLIGVQNLAYNDQLIENRKAQVAASIVRTHEQIREGSQSHYSRQEIVGELLSDTAAYNDPNSTAGNPHYAPSSARYVWTDGQGNFHYTDDPMDKPNQYRGGNWALATPYHHG